MVGQVTIETFDDIRALISALPNPDLDQIETCRARDLVLTKPAGSLGRLEEINRWLCGWQGRHPPRLDDVRVLVFAGKHGVTDQGVSAFPCEVTDQMVANFEAGGAAVNQLAANSGARLQVHALNLDHATHDFSVRPAMDQDACISAFTSGFGCVEPGVDLVAIGEMGIGNTTSAAAIATSLFGGAPTDWAGAGTGLDASGIERKAQVISQAWALHQANLSDPLEVLRHLGGREIAAMAGAILAARLHKVPVLIDGFVSTAAASILFALRSNALDHCLVAHRSAEAGHGRLLRAIEKPPLLDLGMRLGEASGAALAIQIVRAAVACHTGMASFADAGVSERSQDEDSGR